MAHLFQACTAFLLLLLSLGYIVWMVGIFGFDLAPPRFLQNPQGRVGTEQKAMALLFWLGFSVGLYLALYVLRVVRRGRHWLIERYES